jgi:hypothetical protein
MTTASPERPQHRSIDEIRAHAKQYRTKKWKEFRAVALEIAEHRCQRCHRAESSKIVLQVHHTSYRPGSLPWEYEHNECCVLCKSCHAVEHGLIPPFTNWAYVDIEDLDGLDGNCELCSTEIRYVHNLVHPKWGNLAVGCECADLLTNLTTASERQKEAEARVRRRQCFVSSRRWRQLDDTLWVIDQNGHRILIRQLGALFQIEAYGRLGKETKPTLAQMKAFLFDALEGEKFPAWLKKHREIARANRRSQIGW